MGGFTNAKPRRNMIEGWSLAYAAEAQAQGWGLGLFSVDSARVIGTSQDFDKPEEPASWPDMDRRAREAVRQGVAQGDALCVYACKLVSHTERAAVLGDLGALAFEAFHGIPLQE